MTESLKAGSVAKSETTVDDRAITDEINPNLDSIVQDKVSHKSNIQQYLRQQLSLEKGEE